MNKPSCHFFIFFHLRLQLVYRVEFHLGTNAIHECDAHVLAVDVGREVEDVGFDGYALAVEGGAIADMEKCWAYGW